jgi:hypothetical protein
LTNRSYVGFSVSGYELGLNHDSSTMSGGAGGSVAYWGVSDASPHKKNARLPFPRAPRSKLPFRKSGGGIIVASVNDPFGNVFGIIENPTFQASVRRTPGNARKKN